MLKHQRSSQSNQRIRQFSGIYITVQPVSTVSLVYRPDLLSPRKQDIYRLTKSPSPLANDEQRLGSVINRPIIEFVNRERK